MASAGEIKRRTNTGCRNREGTGINSRYKRCKDDLKSKKGPVECGGEGIEKEKTGPRGGETPAWMEGEGQFTRMNRKKCHLDGRIGVPATRRRSQCGRSKRKNEGEQRAAQHQGATCAPAQRGAT